jgi:hypothetical protein
MSPLASARVKLSRAVSRNRLSPAMSGRAPSLWQAAAAAAVKAPASSAALTAT